MTTGLRSLSCCTHRPIDVGHGMSALEPHEKQKQRPREAIRPAVATQWVLSSRVLLTVTDERILRIFVFAVYISTCAQVRVWSCLVTDNFGLYTEIAVCKFLRGWRSYGLKHFYFVHCMCLYIFLQIFVRRIAH